MWWFWLIGIIVFDYLTGWIIIFLLRWQGQIRWVSIKEFWSAFYLPPLFLALAVMNVMIWVAGLVSDLLFLFQRLVWRFRKQKNPIRF